MARLAASIKKLLQGISDGACVSDSRGRLLYINPAAEALLGVTAAKCAGQSLCGMLCARFPNPEQRCAAAHCPLRRRGGGGTSFTIEGRFAAGGTELKKTGTTLNIRCLRLPPSRRCAETTGARLTLLTDVSARAAEEKRREDWRAMAVHDLRAPLTNIYAVLRELQMEAAETPPPPPDAEMLEISVRNCRRMIGMLELYLAVARFDACMMPVTSSALDLDAFIRECVREQSSLAEERGIEVVVDAAPGLKALGDPQLLGRALQNLLNNALKFSAKDGRVTIKAGRDASGRPAISIRDSGPGIDPKDLAFIFDRYAQAGGAGRKEGTGTGLGLTFCRQAVAAMRGELTVESKPGEGSLFTVALLDAAPALNGSRRRGPAFLNGTAPR